MRSAVSRYLTPLLSAALILMLVVGSIESPITKQYLHPFLAQPFFPLIFRIHSRPLSHFMAFALTAAAMFASCRDYFATTASAIALLLTAVVIEYTQHHIYGNPLEWQDVRYDVVGVFAALAAASACRLGQRRPA